MKYLMSWFYTYNFFYNTRIYAFYHLTINERLENIELEYLFEFNAESNFQNNLFKSTH